MEEMINQFASLGAIGIIAGLFLKKYLDEDKEAKKVQAEEKKEDREMYRNTVKEFTTLSKTYAESIASLTVRVENVEEVTEKIDTKVDKILEKVGD